MNLLRLQSGLLPAMLVLTGIAGCAQHSPAPVYDLAVSSSIRNTLAPSNQYFARQPGARLSKPTSAHPSSYRVQPGDTLFSIAWHHSLDHKNLAALNNLRNNTIYPGQLLVLEAEKVTEYFDVESLLIALNSEVLKKPVAIDSALLSARSEGLANNLSRANKPLHVPGKRSAKKNSRKKLVGVTKVSPIKEPLTRVKRGSYQRKNMRKLNWIWPTDGQIVARFSDKSNANRGLDIAAAPGQAVRASAPGRVVYGGNGLRGYGNLVIIKHDNNYLSAYAHNNKIHVSENEFVKAGQRIADIGSSGAQMNKLHFEIRYNGKPVDPLNYLPSK